jgi:hypothetical protein
MTIQLDKLRRIGHHKLHRAVIDRLLHLPDRAAEYETADPLAAD